MNRLFRSLAERGLTARGLVVLSISCLALAYTVTAQDDDSQPEAPATAASGDVERGRYLVEGVGMCGQCHTPRNAVGELQMDEWLHGASVPVTRPKGYPQPWANRAPRIAGLPQHTDEEFVVLMTTGVNRDGRELMAPMPPLRTTEEDALAIAAYLRTLP